MYDESEAESSAKSKDLEEDPDWVDTAGFSAATPIVHTGGVKVPEKIALNIDEEKLQSSIVIVIHRGLRL